MAKFLIIHHSGAEEENAEQIRKYHKSIGYKDIAYNWIIERDGKIVAGRDVHDIGAHCQADSMNYKSEGICVIGDLTKHGILPEQWTSLVKLCKERMSANLIKSVNNILGHKEVKGANTLCPGSLPLNRLREELNQKVKFSDVNPESWSYGIISEAAKIGLIAGYPDGTFQPKQYVTREEMTALLLRLYYLTSENYLVKNTIEKCRKQVCTIACINNDKSNSIGSGVLIDKTHILTNAHVVEKAEKIDCVIEGFHIPGEVEKIGQFTDKNGLPKPIKGNIAIDLAIVKLSRYVHSIEPVSFGTNLADGSFIICIGSPLGFSDPNEWVSHGIISRQTNYYYNTDCAINPGNSGGGAFDLNGNFVGTPTYKYLGADNMGGIIKSDIAKKFLEGREDEIIL